MKYLIALTISCALWLPQTAYAAKKQCGKASWYSATGNTASGERNKKGALTAAHRRLPFGTIVTVTNKRNGKTVKVRINDRGPFRRGFIIDVSKPAANKLDFIRRGITKVCISW